MTRCVEPPTQVTLSRLSQAGSTALTAAPSRVVSPVASVNPPLDQLIVEMPGSVIRSAGYTFR